MRRVIVGKLVAEFDRYEDNRRVFGGEYVPLTDTQPHWALLPGYHRRVPVYLVNLAALGSQCRARLVQPIAERFNISAAEVDRCIDIEGVPIRAGSVWQVTVDVPGDDRYGFEE